MKCVLAIFIFLLLPYVSFAQQDYVSRYDSFAGFSYLNSPTLNLAERGFDAEFGVNVNRWLALGGDYSIFTGHSAIRPQDLTTALQLQLLPILPLLGPNPQVPFDSTTYTFTAGPQINFRHWEKLTLFVRPAIGGMHETATLKPNTPALVLVVQQLAPSGKRRDLEPFYGAGGGFDLYASKHLGLRVGFDYVHVNLFDGLLAHARNSLRIAIGPTFRFGPNVK